MVGVPGIHVHGKEPGDDLEAHAANARQFITRCGGPEGRAIDPEIAATIGGRIHMATITPANGFRWIPGFEPL